MSFLATGRRTDAEMERRIERHVRERPPEWETVEVTAGPADALRRASHGVVLLDCLTFLVSDALLAAGDDAERDDEEAAHRSARAAVEELLDAASEHAGRLIVVTNEVGSGLVPGTSIGRRFRDAQGWANQRVAEAAEEVVLLVAGQPLRVK